MSREKFDALVSKLEEVDLFYNQLNNAQMPIKSQVLIALKRFNKYRNDISLYNVADWASIRYDTVDFIT